MAHSTPASSVAEQQDIPAPLPTPPVLPSSPANTSTSTTPPPSVSLEDLYEYQKCTLVLVVQFRPQQHEDSPRSVLISVQNGANNKEDMPMYRLLSSEHELGGPLPPAIAALLESLRQDLPARKERHEQRTAAKAAAGKTATTHQKDSSATRTTSKQKTPTPSSSPVLPSIPTTTTPLPKELELGGLFDNL